MGNDCPRLKPEILEDLQQCTSYSADEITDWYRIFMRDYPKGRISFKEFMEVHKEIYKYGDPTTYLQHVFRSHDTNCDGIIDFKEFLTAMYIGHRAPFERYIRWNFKIFDIDGDGYISPHEMTEVVRSLLKIDYMDISDDIAYAISQKRTAKAFKVLDKNRDGRISPEELVEGINRHPSALYLFQCETACYRWPPPERRLSLCFVENSSK